MNWLDGLRKLNSDQVFVRHSPMSPRYGRAAQKLRYLLREGIELGSRRPDQNETVSIEIALWAPPTSGRSAAGYYFCFRVYLERETPTCGVLFCFYDGTDRSPSLKSVETASEYAQSQGFEIYESDH